MLAKAELNYYPEEALEKENKKDLKNKRGNRNNRRKRRNNNPLLKLASIISLVFIMAICLFILKGYVNITEMRMEVTQLEEEKTQLERKKSSLNAEIEKAKSSSRISKEAAEKLGMIYPEEDQIVYVSVKDTIEKKKENTLAFKYWNKVLSVFSRLF